MLRIRLTPFSLPGMTRDEKMTRSFGVTSNDRISPVASLFMVARVSPWLPEQSSSS